MFYIIFRFLYFILLCIDFILVCTLTFLCSFLPMKLNRYLMPSLFSKWCAALIRMLGVQYHIHHKFTPPLPKNFLLISNHPSGLDILIQNMIFHVRPLAKEEIQSWWILGRIAKAIDSIFVRREEKDSRHKAKQILIDAVKNGSSLLIYPEGGCFGKHLRPFKYGAFEISLATGVPVLPIYMQYEAENDIEWGDYGLLHHFYNIRMASNKHAHCYIFDPIYPENFHDVSSFADHVHKFYEQWEAKYRLG